MQPRNTRGIRVDDFSSTSLYDALFVAQEFFARNHEGAASAGALKCGGNHELFVPVASSVYVKQRFFHRYSMFISCCSSTLPVPDAKYAV